MKSCSRLCRPPASSKARRDLLTSRYALASPYHDIARVVRYTDMRPHAHLPLRPLRRKRARQMQGFMAADYACRRCAHWLAFGDKRMPGRGRQRWASCLSEISTPSRRTLARQYRRSHHHYVLPWQLTSMGAGTNRFYHCAIIRHCFAVVIWPMGYCEPPLTWAAICDDTRPISRLAHGTRRPGLVTG